jgi:hypothetical protein
LPPAFADTIIVGQERPTKTKDNIMENKEANKDNKTINPFADPFKSGLIKKDAIDIIMQNKELMEAIKKIKL